MLYSLRHTALTRLGETGADAFTIMRIAGHSSVTALRAPFLPGVGLALARLDSANRRAAVADRVASVSESHRPSSATSGSRAASH